MIILLLSYRDYIYIYMCVYFSTNIYIYMKRGEVLRSIFCFVLSSISFLISNILLKCMRRVSFFINSTTFFRPSSLSLTIPFYILSIDAVTKLL